MPTIEIIVAFCLLEFTASLVPGPAVLVVASQAMTSGAARTGATIAGVLAGNVMYFAASAAGLGAVLLASYEVFFLIKWLGAAYLVWLGIQTIRETVGPLNLRAARGGPAGMVALFRRGFVTQAANPKAILFFVALLPQFIDPAGDVPLQMAVLTVLSVLMELPVLAGYAWLGGGAARMVRRPSLVAWFNRAAGGLLIAAGVGMAALRRAD